MRIAILVVVCVGVFISIYIIAIRYARRKVLRKLYQPVKTIIEWTSIPILRDIYISTRSFRWSYDRPVFAGENINVWYGNWFDHRPVILYFHGNSLNISYREYMAKLCMMMRVNVLLVDYRGYGRSDGTQTSRGILHDGDAAMNFLLTQKDIGKIIVWGESAGGPPACYVASKYSRIRKLVLLSTFTSLHSLLINAESTTHKFLFALARLATPDTNKDTNNEEFLRKCKCPVMVIHSETDTLIPYSNARDLVLAVRKDVPATLVKIAGDHDSPKFDPVTMRALLDFVGVEYTRETMNEIIALIDSISQTR